MSLSLAAESWTWYSFVLLVVLFRFTSRIIHLGSWKRLQIEDYLMLFITIVYTNLVAFMQIVAYADTNLMLPSDIPTLTPASIQSRIYGSKLVLVVEQCMITTQWGCKICLLLIYYKLTMGLKQTLAVKVVGCYVVLGWVVMEILYFGVWCRPFDQYWAVPVYNEQCSAAIHHLITNAVFNISSDIMMLCIPLPLLITSQLPPLKKAVLCCLFGLGVFVILCAALNKYYSFTEPFSPIWTFWYIREASTAVLVANIPNCWPLLRRIFHLRSFSGSSDPTSGAQNNSRRLPMSGGRIGPRVSGLQGVKIASNDPDSSTWSGRSHHLNNNKPAQKIAKSESLEYINGSPDGTQSGGGGGHKEIPLEIWQDVEVSIHKFDAEDGESIRRKELYDGVKNGDGNLGYKTKTVVTASNT